MKLIKASLVGGLILLAAAAPAAAASPDDPRGNRPTEPAARLSLSISGGATSAARSVELTCDPDGGSHPSAVAACSLLREVDGDPASLRPGRQVCMGLYDPRTARLTGTWRGLEVSYEQTFENECALLAATGSIFAF